MSLVNEMLKELKASEPELCAVDGLRYPSSSKNSNLWIIYILSSIVVLFILFFIYIGIPFNKIATIITATDKNTTQLSPLKTSSKNIAQQNNSSIQSVDYSLSLLKKNISSKDTPEEITNKQTNPKQFNENEKDATLKTTLIAVNQSNNNSHDKNIKTRPTDFHKDNQSRFVKSVSKSSIARKDLKHIIQHWEQNNLSKNIDQINTLLDKNTNRVSLHLSALSFLKDKDKNSYRHALNRASRHFPTDTAIAVLSSQLYLTQGKYNLAQQALTFSKKKSFSTYRLSAFIYQKQELHQQAIENYKRVIPSAKNKGQIYMAMGISHEALKQNSEAIRIFSIALKDARLNDIQKQFINQRLIILKG